MNKNTNSTEKCNVEYLTNTIIYKLKQMLPKTRISKQSPVFLTAIIKFLVRYLLNIIVKEVKKEGENGISSFHIERAILQDQALKKILNNSILYCELSLKPNKPSIKKLPINNKIESLNFNKTDTECLNHCKWLNDKTIDFYLVWIEKKYKKKNKIYIFLVNFWIALKNKKNNDIEHFSKRYDKFAKIMKKKYVLIPINHDHHWSLCVICFPGKQNMNFIIFDSLFDYNEAFIKLIKDPIVTFFSVRSNSEGEGSVDIIKNAPWYYANVPRQNNGYDCGVFLLHYAELFYVQEPTTLDLSRWFNIKGIPEKRNKIKEIMTRYLDDKK